MSRSCWATELSRALTISLSSDLVTAEFINFTVAHLQRGPHVFQMNVLFAYSLTFFHAPLPTQI